MCVCVCSSGGLAAEEPGQRSERRPMRRHTHAEEKAPEHLELHAGSAQERALETTGPAGKHGNTSRCDHASFLRLDVSTNLFYSLP